ncbi:hypothetical protein EJ08DRAFT_658719 [Tothia fuscella]|uniref:Endoplasmic reticulum junction formation protein lunapark n=1 Tax=Tothia fuscella TaxID=1048955 RepID=A0A9P4NVX3_9PEZI|nr:hypothetical protein EJ08DRAFT_658719 [Tothia fuscella]
MPSLWPWRRDDTSAESFEKSLSALAVKISKTSGHLDNLRQRSRKFKVSWTLYAGFAYILATLILTLITGWSNWGAIEYTTVAGGPLVLYGGRKLLSLWYDYRISNTQDYLDSINKERDATIEKLKTATKYNSTQQLLEKYGSKPSTPQAVGGKKQKTPTSKGKADGPRLPFQPPPTANISRGPNAQGPPHPQLQPQPPPAQTQLQPRPRSPQGPTPSAEFAPNAYSSPSQYTSEPSFGESHWYDRILDALLGEDEALAKNRFALICSNCRLVNGQAPPGAKSLEDVGKWRCSGCGTLNGKESETAKVIKEVSKIAEAEKKEGHDSAVGDGSEADDFEDAEDVGEESVVKKEEESSSSEGAVAETPARSTRSKSKSKGKK